MNQETNPPPHAPQDAPSGWLESLAGLVSNRIALIQLELKQAAQQRVRALICVIAGAVCAFFTWVLLLAGGIYAISVASGWPWHLVTLCCAALHLVVAILLFRTAMAPKSPPFPHTREEFRKDREWIESLQNKPESKS